MDANNHVYPCPPGIRPATHERFLAGGARATMATALPLQVLAETPDEEEDEGGAAAAGDPEDLGAGPTGG